MRKITIILIFIFTTDLYAMCGDPATAIHEIQGSGEQSPLVDQTVTVEAVVTASFQGANRLNGFFLQAPQDSWDDDDRTSEGIFVNDGDFGVLVNAGEIVRVNGTVKERFGLTQLRSVSEILNCGNASRKTRSRKVSFPLNEAGRESLESMKVRLVDPMAVTDVYNLGRFGEIMLSYRRPLSQATQIAAPGDAAMELQTRQSLYQILLDDDNNRQNRDPIFYEINAESSVRVGDRVDELVGILSYAFGSYRLRPIEVEFQFRSRPRAPQREGLRIASFNLGNYFNGDGMGTGFPTSRGADTQDEFLRQRSKLVAALRGLDAQLIGVQEIENDGTGPQSSIVDLAGGLSQATARTYIPVVPANGDLGNDAISVGMIYDNDALQAVGEAVSLHLPPFDDLNRPPLAQTFKTKQGVIFTVVVNHLKSKSCRSAKDDNKDQQDGQACWNSLRVAAAEALVEWLQTQPTGVESKYTIIMGDLNSYAKEDPLQRFAERGFINPLKSRYTYHFSGKRGSLDYILVNKKTKKRIEKAGVWHINADEPRVLDYNTEFKSPRQQSLLYSTNPYRSSDHDPVYVDLQLTEDD